MCGTVAYVHTVLAHRLHAWKLGNVVSKPWSSALICKGMRFNVRPKNSEFIFSFETILFHGILSSGGTKQMN
jgi:hypothetical protein